MQVCLSMYDLLLSPHTKWLKLILIWYITTFLKATKLCKNWYCFPYFPKGDWMCKNSIRIIYFDSINLKASCIIHKLGVTKTEFPFEISFQKFFNDQTNLTELLNPLEIESMRCRAPRFGILPPNLLPHFGIKMTYLNK